MKIKRFQKALRKEGIDIAIIANLKNEDRNLFYFTDMELGYSFLLIPKKGNPILLTNKLELERAQKYSGINKGKAALQKMGDTKFDFILAVGDDWTDEFTFDVMPEGAYSIKVGTKSTKAAYYIESVELVRELLCRFRKENCNDK